MSCCKNFAINTIELIYYSMYIAQAYSKIFYVNSMLETFSVHNKEAYLSTRHNKQQMKSRGREDS